MIRLLIVDDHPILRDALATLLGTKPGLEVMGTTAGIRDTLAFVERRVPDLMLVDLSLQDGSGVQLVSAMRRLGVKTRILIMSGFRDEFAVSHAFAAGVAGYVLKGQATSELLEAIDVVSKGGRYVAPDIAAHLHKRPVRGASGGRVARLTSREHEIFRLFVAGGATKEIAGRLFITIKTVDTHRANINRKLGVRTTADLIRFAAAQGIAIAPSAPADDIVQVSLERSVRRRRSSRTQRERHAGGSKASRR